jgi:hypothetical protein
MHVVGGRAEQRMDRPYHHAYDPASNRWAELPKVPRGANHVGVATHGERIYAFGGFLEQNRTPHDAPAPSTASAGTRCAACRKPAARWPASRSGTTSPSSLARSARATGA